MEGASIVDEALRPPLIEREHVWERAIGGLEAARSGRGSAVLLEGPAGLGKSALIRAIGSHAAETGMEVLTAAGRRGEKDFGFGVVVQLFEPRLGAAEEEERASFLSDAAREAVPIFTPGNRQVEPTFDVLHGLYRLCETLAFDMPLALLIDDVDLADWQSLRFLAYLAERMGEHAMALVLATGSVPHRHVPELVNQIARHPATVRCELAPLTARGTAERVRAAWPEATEEACSEVNKASGGNPFLIDALTAELAGTSGEAGPAIAAWTLRRARWLHEDAAALLRAVAVLAPRCELRNAATLAALDAETATAVADVLIEAGILKPEEHLAFEQPAVADSIEAFQAPGERSAAHLAAARLLSADEESPEIVACHLLKAMCTASGWVVDTLCAAAAIALGRGAPPDAVRYLRRALEEPPSRGQRAHVVRELGRAEAMAGEPQAADRLSEGAVEYAAEAPEQPAAALATGRTLFALGQTEQAMAVFERAIAEADADPEMARWLHAGHLAARRLSGLSEGATVTDEAPPATADAPGQRALLALHAMEGAIRGVPCSEVRELALRALANGALLDDETADGMPYYLAAAALAVAEELQTAEAALTAAVEDAQTRGSVLGFATASAVRAMTILLRGRVTDAAADARNALAVERHGWRLGVDGARVVLAHSLIESGDLPGAERQLNMGEAATDEAHPGRIWLLVARGRIQLLSGDADRALEDFLASGELAEKAGARNPALLAWRSGAGLACAAIGDRMEAERLIETELSLAETFGAPGPVGRALRAMASIRAPQPALETLEAAVETLEGSQAALERARALVDFGAALRRSGRRREARAPLRAGLEIAQGCGAEVLALRAMRETTAAGARPRRTALTGLNSLTVRERQAASLAAEGLSNREIAETLVVTVKTVEWHLKHSYRKLGIDSRQRLGEFFGPGER